MGLQELLRNYLFLLKEKENSIPKESRCKAEFTKNEIERVEEKIKELNK